MYLSTIFMFVVLLLLTVIAANWEERGGFFGSLVWVWVRSLWLVASRFQCLKVAKVKVGSASEEHEELVVVVMGWFWGKGV